MSDVPKKLVSDLSTGLQQYIDYTPEEIEQHELESLASVERATVHQAEFEAREALKESARAKLIAGEPLTEEEAAVLVI